MNIAFDFCNQAGMGELVDGDEIYFVLSFSVPPVSYLRKLLCFHEFIQEITFQGSACEAFVIVFDVAAQEREQIALYQRLIWIDEPEPEAQEVIMDFVCRNFSVFLSQ